MFIVDSLTNPVPLYGWSVVSRRVHRQASIVTNSRPDERIGRVTVNTKVDQLSLSQLIFSLSNSTWVGAGVEPATTCMQVRLTIPLRHRSYRQKEDLKAQAEEQRNSKRIKFNLAKFFTQLFFNFSGSIFAAIKFCEFTKFLENWVT